MSAKEYELLKKKSAAAGLSINAWLMAQLESSRPTLHREEETWDAIRFMDEAGREINVTARDFNSGYGTAERLQNTARPGDRDGRLFSLCADFWGRMQVNAYAPKNSARTSSQLSTASSSAPVRVVRAEAATACLPNTVSKLPRNSRTAATVTSSSGSKVPSS